MDPFTLSNDDWGVQSPPKRKVFRFHYHSQKVIGSLGVICLEVCSSKSSTDLSRGSGDSKTFEKEQFIEIELALSTRWAPSIVINGVVGAAINGRK